MKKTRIRFFKFSDGKQNLQFHWPKGIQHSRFTNTFDLLLIDSFSKHESVSFECFSQLSGTIRLFAF